MSSSSGDELLAHVAVALSRYVKECRRDGVRVPDGMTVVLSFLTDLVTARQDATPLGAASAAPDDASMTSLLTKREAAHDLRCSVRTVERLIKDGALPAVSVAGGTRIRRADLDVYVAGLAPRSFRDEVETKESA